MHSALKLFSIVVGGVALGACGSAHSSELGSLGDGDGGTAGSNGSSSGGSTLTNGSSSGASSSSSSSSGGGSSSGGSSSGASSSSSSSSGGSTGYAIPLAAPEGSDSEYTAQLTIGGQAFAMQIDTGSTTAAVAGTSCSGCTGVSPLYTPSSTAMVTGQQGSSVYEDQSSWSGPIYADSVGLGSGSPSVSIDLVEITTASVNSSMTTAFFTGGNDCQGILGLGPSGNAIAGTTGYMPAVMKAGVTNVFAFKLCDNTGSNAGTMWLGGDGSPESDVVYTPLVAISNNNPYYAINVDGMSLGGTSIVASAASTFAQPVLDTGTSLFYVPTTVFNAFQTALEASSGFKTLFGSNTFATSGNNAGCLTDASVTDAQVESMLPSLTLSLPNVTSGQADVTIQASALDTYFYDGGGGQFCLAIQDGGPPTQDPSTFGDAFLQAFLTIVDVQGGRVGFATTSCATPQIRRVRHPAKTGPHRGPRPARP
jgi:Eukaryotic aspartyl protease